MSCNLKEQLKQQGKTIYDLVTVLEDRGILSRGASGNYTTISLALSGKRSTKRYLELRNKCSEIINYDFAESNK